MNILLIALPLMTDIASIPAPTQDAQASVTIVRGGEVSSRNWDPAIRPSQREIIRIEKDGRRVLIRLTEFE